MRIRRLAAVTAAALVLAVTGCGSSAPTPGGGSSSGGGEQPYIAIVSKGFQHQFWQAVKKGAEQEAQKQGVRISFDGPATEADVEAQVTMLTNALGKQPAAIGFAALDSRAAAPLLQQAKTQNIPVIAFDSGVDSDIPLTTAATDNKAAAAEAAKHLSEALGGTGKVALVVHDQTSKSGTDRRDGFTEWMQANAPGIQLLEPQYGGGDQAKSADITKSILVRQPRPQGHLRVQRGIGHRRASRACRRAAARASPSSASTPARPRSTRSAAARCSGAITQNPVGMGEQLVAAAVKATKGESLPKVIDTGFYWYDKNNIDIAGDRGGALQYQ